MMPDHLVDDEPQELFRELRVQLRLFGQPPEPGDLRLLAPDASFHFLFTRVGLAGADMGAAYLLPRVVGLGRATEIVLTLAAVR